jgi:CRP-like cAMP-binding protein
MQVFSAWPERQAHLLRCFLLTGWLLLIVSLIFGLDPYPFDVNRCGSIHACHDNEGNQIFWGMVVPMGLLILIVLSHEVWRRICPLAFVSQLFRALGRQRTLIGRGGKREVAKVEPDSWLGRHHLQLQWSLLIAGLCLRLLVLNSNNQALGLFLLATIAAALVVGWAYGGKAWCQYICPMAPVQTVVTGPRSFLGSPAHFGTESRITQSMCRTLGGDGQTQSACVGCQAPCLDIDSERAYWQTIAGKRGLAWAWLSYPGLVIAFFLLIRAESTQGLDYLRSGMWAYDNAAILNAWKPLPGLWSVGLPRLLAFPLLLVLAAVASVAVFSRLERFLQARLAAESRADAAALATSRTRLLATFLAVNAFFWFADPSLGMVGGSVGQLIRSVVLIVSGMWLHRGWHRDKGAYTRESTSASLRRQLTRLVPDLDPYLGGRTLAELNAGEVFTLAKALPVQISETKRSIYRGVVADLLSTGRLDRAASLVQLEELRATLDLKQEDHFAAIRELAVHDPRILQLDALQRENRNLRQEAAAEAIEELMQLQRMADLNGLLQQPHLRERLEEIRQRFGLDEPSWEELLSGFGPASVYSRASIELEIDSLHHQLAARAALEQAADREPLLRPLLPVIDRRITSHAVMIAPALLGFPPADPLVRYFEGLRRHFPPSVLSLIRRREQEIPGVRAGVEMMDLGRLPDPAVVLDELWQDPDPDTALWVLWVQQRRSPERGEALRHTPRLGLASNASLDGLLREEELEGAELMERLLQVPLVEGLPPAALLDLVRWGERRCWEPGETLFPMGAPADSVAILLEGSCEVLGGDDHGGQAGQGALRLATVRAGEPIGEVAYFTEQPRQVSIRAGGAPVEGLVFSSSHFESLLQQSTDFSRGLLQQMALKIVGLYSRHGHSSVSGERAVHQGLQDGSPTSPAP